MSWSFLDGFGLGVFENCAERIGLIFKVKDHFVLIAVLRIL